MQTDVQKTENLVGSKNVRIESGDQVLRTPELDIPEPGEPESRDLEPSKPGRSGPGPVETLPM